MKVMKSLKKWLKGLETPETRGSMSRQAIAAAILTTGLVALLGLNGCKKEESSNIQGPPGAIPLPVDGPFQTCPGGYFFNGTVCVPGPGPGGPLQGGSYAAYYGDLKNMNSMRVNRFFRNIQNRTNPLYFSLTYTYPDYTGTGQILIQSYGSGAWSGVAPWHGVNSTNPTHTDPNNGGSNPSHRANSYAITMSLNYNVSSYPFRFYATSSSINGGQGVILRFSPTTSDRFVLIINDGKLDGTQAVINNAEIKMNGDHFSDVSLFLRNF
jgi:hypothetical protein